MQPKNLVPGLGTVDTIAGVAQGHLDKRALEADIVRDARASLPADQVLANHNSSERAKTHRWLVAAGLVVTLAAGGVIEGERIVGGIKSTIAGIFHGSPDHAGFIDVQQGVESITIPTDVPVMEVGGKTGSTFTIDPHYGKLGVPFDDTTIRSDLSVTASTGVEPTAIKFGLISTPTKDHPSVNDEANWQLTAAISNEVETADNGPKRPADYGPGFTYGVAISKVTGLSSSSQFTKRATDVFTDNNASGASATLINYSEASWANNCTSLTKPVLPQAIGKRLVTQLTSDKSILSAIHEQKVEDTITSLLDKGILVTIVDRQGNPIDATDVILPTVETPTKDELTKQLHVSSNELHINHANDCMLSRNALGQLLALQATVPSATNEAK